MSELRLALFGDPVDHSLSPKIQQAFARQFGLAISYELIKANASEFTEKLAHFKAGGASGCNITVPLKQVAFALADQCSSAGQQAGAVNTFVFKATGIDADNTDGRGWLNDLHQSPAKIKGYNICLIGAGGAAAGLLPLIMAENPARVIIANRSKDKALQLLAGQTTDHSDANNAMALSLSELANSEALQIDLLINATSIGHQGLRPDINPKILQTGALIYDLNYGQAAEPLANWCKQNKLTYRDGLGMLVEQAALAFKLWTGKQADTKPVLSELRVRSLSDLTSRGEGKPI